MNKSIKILILLLIGTFSGNAGVKPVIEGYESTDSYNGYPLYVVQTTPIYVSLGGGYFDKIIVDNRVLETKGDWDMYELDIRNYVDGKPHSLQLRRINLDLSDLCYFIIKNNGNNESENVINIDGIFYNIISQSQLEMEVTHKYVNNKPLLNESYEGDITIPNYVNYNNRTYTITRIGDYAFGGTGKGCQISSIVLPNTVNSIGSNAFANSSISNISLPENLEVIGDHAFYKSKLTNIKIPESTKSIGNYTFYQCENLKEVQLGNSLEEISEYTFYNCKNLTDLTFGNSIKSIGKYAFKYCTSLSLLKLSNSITSINSQAFSDCSNLNTAILSRDLESISSDAFASCPNLLEVFYISPNKPNGQVSATNSNMKSYVPSSKNYGFGKDYITFSGNQFQYTGSQHNVYWTNNIKYLNCDIDPIETEINAGNYEILVKANYTGEINISLDIPYEYKISKAPLNLTVDNFEREYGEPNPIFSCSVNGFVPGEDLSLLGVAPVYECAATQLSQVGSYRILAYLDVKNYEVTYNYGSLTIYQAPITVTVVPAAKIYGDSNPDFRLSYTGLKNDEVSPIWNVIPTFNTNAINTSSVGEYEVSVSGGELVNYFVSKYIPGTLSILKRDLIVKAKDAERLYGEENPVFQISYSGFVNNDNYNSLLTLPEAYCDANAQSDSGQYPIKVEGGSSDNYNFKYQQGVLLINPLTVGFQNIYNTCTFNDMNISTTDKCFNYIPPIIGPFSEDDFWIDLWFLDGDNKYSNHVYTENSGSYKGNYVNTNYDRPMQAGKYIFNLTSKGTNPNVVANPSRCYLTVGTASNNLTWDVPSPIYVRVGETIDLGIDYDAYIYCQFNTDYDKDLIELSNTGSVTNNPHWFATGLNEGQTTMYFNITCLKNDLGFYDFYDSRTLNKTIKVLPADSFVDKVENDNILIKVENGVVYIHGKTQETDVLVYNINGYLIYQTKESMINGLQRGLYIIKIGNITKKIVV